MSTAILSPADDFEAFEFAAIVAGFTQPMGEPLPEPERRLPRQRSRSVEEREAIDQSQGIYRHRTSERRD